MCRRDFPHVLTRRIETLGGSAFHWMGGLEINKGNSDLPVVEGALRVISVWKEFFDL